MHEIESGCPLMYDNVLLYKSKLDNESMFRSIYGYSEYSLHEFDIVVMRANGGLRCFMFGPPSFAERRNLVKRCQSNSNT
jgi:hypothetical protein